MFDIAQQIVMGRARQASIDSMMLELWAEREKIDLEMDYLLDKWLALR